MTIKFKKLNDKAVAPKRAHKTDAGYDLTCTEVEEQIDGNVRYHSGIAVEIPEGHVGLVFPRSSIYKTGMQLTNSVGVIDAGYRGEIMAVMRRQTYEFAPYRIGDRFAQLIIMPIPDVTYEEATELSDSDRGEGGYGSSGK